MGNSKGRTITEQQIESLFALKHCVRTVDRHGQVKLHHHVFYVDEGLQKEKIDIFIYNMCLDFTSLPHSFVKSRQIELW